MRYIAFIAAALVLCACSSGQASQGTQVNRSQQTLAHDVSALKQSARTLVADAHYSVVPDSQQIRSDYGRAQSDYRVGRQRASCSDGSMRADASAVATDASKVHADLSSLQTDVQGIQGSASDLKLDMSTVQRDVNMLAKAGATPSADHSGAIAAANKALSDVNNEISRANQQANTIDRQAHQLATTARNYANSHCR